MATIFTKIIEGEIPGRFLWKDDVCVSFLDVRPLARGHALVVPRAEVDHWTDLPVDAAAHLMAVAHAVGNAQRQALAPARIGLMVAGFEVPHVHVHVVPMDSMANLDFSNVDTAPDAHDLDALRIEIVQALRFSGHEAAAG